VTPPVTEILYLAASVLFILGLSGLRGPGTARRGVGLAAAGMLLAVVGTLLHREIVRYEWIVAGLVVGSVIGAAMAVFIPMTKMPERIALSHAFGGLAAALVGVSEYARHGGDLGTAKTAAVGFEVMLGALTFTGSLMAFGKLQGLLPELPVTYRLQNVSNVALLLLTLGGVGWLVGAPPSPEVFYAMLGASLLLGVLMVLPIGGADMPVVISLLNSYAGLAASSTGFALANNVLIICGALDGASGFILSMAMSRAMNRSFANVLFGAFGTPAAAGPAGPISMGPPVREATAEEAAAILEAARSVIVVPGYGMAVAQAQHVVRELADLLARRGASVRYAIHPVAGRMPGHMNVLLAEANVPYDQLSDLEAINDEFARTDVALVVGANDVVNPAARTDPQSPIYGMPVLDAALARAVIVLKRSMKPGFAGIENALFVRPNTVMVFGDARETLRRMVAALKA
jgi:NAD(P) transhydrogenase subunit beta